MHNLKIEDILDLAIDELTKGHSLSDVLSNYPNHTKELQTLLATIEPAIKNQTLNVPTPKRQYRYAKELKMSWASKFTRLFKAGLVPATAVILFVAGTQVVTATQQSLPGESLFRFKLAAERTRVAITTNQNDKARLEISYSQKRLAETQEVLAKEDSSPEQQAEALASLKEQTEKTFALVPTVATTDIINNNDSSLFRDLIAVNNQQKDLLKELSSEEQIKDIASTALEATADQDKTITTLLAAVNDKELIDLVTPAIETKGTVTAISFIRNEITVDGNVFALSESSEIKHGDKTILLTNLPINTTVKIWSEKTDSMSIANKVDIIELPTSPVLAPINGEVKGAATSKPQDPSNPNNQEKPIEPTPTPMPVEPNTVTGGYIAEQPE